MNSTNYETRSRIQLVAFDDGGQIVEQAELELEQYYAEPQAMIDDEPYRLARGIRRIIGRVFDTSGRVQAEFENLYDDSGLHSCSRGVHQENANTLA